MSVVDRLITLPDDLGAPWRDMPRRRALMNPAVSPCAVALARIGAPVFPVHGISLTGSCTCGNPDCRNPGKHPRTARGLLDATTDLEIIGQWWEKAPRANVGVVTGPASGIWVLDLDGTDGDAAIAELEALYAPLSPTWCVETGGGGLHLWYRITHRVPRSSAGTIAPGIDVRGDGGYVIAPPSRHISGRPYQWAPDWSPPMVTLAAAPDWLLDLVAPAGLAGPRPRAEPIPERLAEGQRNSGLTSLAGSMRRRGASEAAILAALDAENAARCDPPLPQREVERIAHSVGRYPPA